MRKIALGLMLTGLLALLCGCQALDALQMEGEKTASAPDLTQLVPMAYQPDARQDAATAEESSAYLVDLWLDATRNMGGVNTIEGTLYPHSGTRYREGGFHYHYAAQAGWYESVLEDMLLSADGHRVRVLRFGDEWADETLLREGGLLGEEADEERVRSLRRDLMTYALSPELTLFSAMSGEDMTDSFYALGGSALGRVAELVDAGETGLENDAQAVADTARLWRQKLAQGGQTAETVTLTHSKLNVECPLFTALDTMDLRRLNVLVFDPASLRRLTAVESTGETVAYLQQLLQSRGVFDAGNSVGLMALRLDYLGQMDSVGPADLALPLIWGKTLAKPQEGQYYAGCMPRIALLLAVGQPAQVREYLDALCLRLDEDEALAGERGPQRGELTYAAAGQTIVQQPFTFAYWRAELHRPSAGLYTQNTPGAQVTSGGVAADTESGLPLVTLSPDENGRLSDAALTITLPVQAPENGMTLSASQLTARAAHVLCTLALEEERPNRGGAAVLGEQVLTLRDTQYVFRRVDEPYAADASASPFTLGALEIRDGQLTAVVRADASKLRPGYYRLQIEADVRGDSMTWPAVEWIDGEASLDAAITTEDEALWETFTALAYQQETKNQFIDARFHHAWGEANGKPYFGTAVPDCPPVYLAPQLKELTRQLRQAAGAQTEPYLRFVLDVFVDNQAAEGEAK